MLAMIFRLFLQTGEDDFFVSRMQNAASTIGQQEAKLYRNYFKDDGISVRTHHYSLHQSSDTISED